MHNTIDNTSYTLYIKQRYNILVQCHRRTCSEIPWKTFQMENAESKKEDILQYIRHPIYGILVVMQRIGKFKKEKSNSIFECKTFWKMKFQTKVQNKSIMDQQFSNTLKRPIILNILNGSSICNILNKWSIEAQYNMLREEKLKI